MASRSLQALRIIISVKGGLHTIYKLFHYCPSRYPIKSLSYPIDPSPPFNEQYDSSAWMLLLCVMLFNSDAYISNVSLLIGNGSRLVRS